MSEWLDREVIFPELDKIICWSDQGMFMYELIETKWGNHYRCMRCEESYIRNTEWTHWMPLPTPPGEV